MLLCRVLSAPALCGGLERERDSKYLRERERERDSKYLREREIVNILERERER